MHFNKFIFNKCAYFLSKLFLIINIDRINIRYLYGEKKALECDCKILAQIRIHWEDI